MLAKSIINNLRKPGTVYVEVILRTHGDPVPVEAKKTDLIRAYQSDFDSNEETGMKLITLDDGNRVLVTDHIEETKGV